VPEHCVTGFERKPEVLSAPAHSSDVLTRKPVLEVLRARQVPAYRAWVQHADPFDVVTDRERLQATADHLDLRQLRHCQSTSSSG
jgi:hypothetical protein